MTIHDRYFDFRPAYLVPGVRELVLPRDNTYVLFITIDHRSDQLLSDSITPT
jgi:hypothetical protein